MLDILSIPHVIVVRKMLQYWMNNRSISIWVMGWCRPVICHYLNQWLPSSLTKTGGIRIEWVESQKSVNTLRPSQNGHHFANNIFKCISLNKNFWILNEIHSNMFLGVYLTIWLPQFRRWLVAVQATRLYLNQWWRRLPTHLCVTRPQWVKDI